MSEDTRVDQYERILIAINILRRATVGREPTAADIRKAEREAKSRGGDVTAEDILRKGGFGTRDERQAAIATIKDIERWADEIHTRVQRQWERGGNLWTEDISEAVKDDIAFILMPAGDLLKDPRFQKDSVNQLPEWQRMARLAIFEETEFGRAVPGALTFRVRKREIAAGMVKRGLLTEDERSAIVGEAGFPELEQFAIQFNTQLEPQISDFMEMATAVVRGRGGLGAMPGPGKLAALTQNVISGATERDIATGLLPLPDVAVNREEPGTRLSPQEQLARDLVPDEDGNFGVNQIRDAVNRSLQAQGFPLVRDAYDEEGLTKEQSDAIYTAVIKARNRIVSELQGVAAENFGLAPEVVAAGLADIAVREVTSDSFVRRTQVSFELAEGLERAREREKAREGEQSAQAAKNIVNTLLSSIGGIRRSDITDASYENLVGRVINEGREAVERDLNDSAFRSDLKTAKRREDAEKLTDDPDAASKAARVAIHKASDGAFTDKDMLPEDFATIREHIANGGDITKEDVQAGVQRKAETERREEQEKANIAALAPGELERTFAGEGVGELGATGTFQQDLRRTVIPQVGARLETLRRQDPTRPLDVATETRRLLGIGEFREPSGQLEQVRGRVLSELGGVDVDVLADQGLRPSELNVPLHPLVRAEREILGPTATPLEGIDFTTQRQFEDAEERARMQVERTEVPTLRPLETAALGEVGVEPVPTLDRLGARREVFKLDIPEDEELLRLAAELAEGDVELENFIISQFPSLLKDLEQSGKVERKRREESAFKRFGFQQIGDEETAPGASLPFSGRSQEELAQLSPEQRAELQRQEEQRLAQPLLKLTPGQRSRLITQVSAPELVGFALPESQKLSPFVRTKLPELKTAFRDTPRFKARQQRDAATRAREAEAEAVQRRSLRGGRTIVRSGRR
jgi:hypothetical protein